MYIPGVTKVADLPNDVETKEHYKAEQKQRHQELMIRKYKRLRDGAVDPVDRQRYNARVKDWSAKHEEFLKDHPYLRKNPKRLAPEYTGNVELSFNTGYIANNMKLGVGENKYKEGEIVHIDWPDRNKYPIHDSKDIEKMYIFAEEHGFSLRHIEGYRGDYESIKESLNVAKSVLDYFPEMGNKPIVLRLGNKMKSADFALTETNGTIFLNADAFRDRFTLAKEYSAAVDDKKFVENTTFTGILCHELGHRFALLHPEIDYLSLAKDVVNDINLDYNGDVIDFVFENLSQYSASFDDGREIISECFSGYFGGSGNLFALKYIEKLVKIL